MRLQIWSHIWKQGHSIEVKKYQTELARHDPKAHGWLYTCECGKEWAR